MKRMYNQPNLEQMQLQSTSIMDPFGVSIVDEEYNGGGNAPLRRPNW